MDNLDLENNTNSISQMVRNKSDPVIFTNQMLRNFMANFQQVIFASKLSLLFLAVPLALVANFQGFARPWIFAWSLLGLAPLAERVSFLTEQIAYYTGPTVGGLLNATCGNATEIIIALYGLSKNKVNVVKFSLLGSILSNLLLVLGTSLLCAGLANLKREQKYDRPLLFKMALEGGDSSIATSTLQLSRASSIFMLLAYVAYIYFQLKTHGKLFDAQEEDEDEEKPVIGFWSAFIWLVGMTLVISVLSEYVVGTIEDASDSWGISVGFISIILLPIVGNAAEHAGSVIFAFKNKLDMSLGIAMGSATQISMFVVPLSVVVAWIMDIQMELDFNLLETGCLAFTIVVTAFTLQDGTSHYMKGVVLSLCYIVMAACFFVHKTPLDGKD